MLHNWDHIKSINTADMFLSDRPYNYITGRERKKAVIIVICTAAMLREQPDLRFF